ncbi:MAG: LPP20 family lipoprotein [Deltaproteobacteria bacterium]|nr:LPP20 family lipoprotein [Deltaproteobacteria bacterium]
MKKRFIVVMAIVISMFFLTGLTGVYAQQGNQGQYVQNIGASGSVNWTSGLLTAVGIGAPPERFYGKPQARPMAMRAAQVDAYRKLLEVANGVRVDATTMVRDYAVESDVVRTQVEGIVRGAQIVKSDYLSDGTVEVTVQMPLAGASGSLGQAIYPQMSELGAFPPAPPVGYPTAPPVPATPGVETPAPPAAPVAPVVPAAPATSAVYTGLVIDARGIQARPAMSPKIVDENGEEVYGSMYVDREYAVQQGMAGYARDLTAAQTNSRVTNTPYTVKGLKAEGPGKSNIVISTADATHLKSAAENLTFMKKCRVMIVLD